MADLLQKLTHICGPQQVLTTATDTAPYLLDQRRRYQGKALAVIRPASTAEVAAIVKVCAEAGVAMVPQGGNTGLCGGATPSVTGEQVVISLVRLNQIRSVDAANNTATVEAGVTLLQLQAAAENIDRLFPLSLASEGSCQIGGNLATNAGGVQVLRYGNTRDLTLGLEVVLPNGEIWQGLRGLRKDNTGYDLKHLFIGSEGTLGIITAAVMKLSPRPAETLTVLLKVDSPSAALILLRRLEQQFGGEITAFEFMSGVCLELVAKHLPQIQQPWPTPHPWQVLFEISSGPNTDLPARLYPVLQSLQMTDAAVAQSQVQAAQLWAIREHISEAQRLDGVSIKQDISLPISAIPDFLDVTASTLAARFPGVRIVAFGHLGDGNLHYNISYTRPNNTDLLADEAAVNELVYREVATRNGSISAEHGLGQLKRDTITHYKSALELELMRQIKHTLDPKGLMNPGKLI